MNIRFTALLTCGLAAITLSGCTRDILPNTPEQLTLYSIDCREPKGGDGDGLFHRYPVLGQIEVTDARQRAELAGSLRAAMIRKDTTRLACFWPRHGIRTVERGRVIDYLICFECGNAIAYEGKRETHHPVANEQHEVFDRHLTTAGIALSPDRRDVRKE